MISKSTSVVALLLGISFFSTVVPIPMFMTFFLALSMFIIGWKKALLINGLIDIVETALSIGSIIPISSLIPLLSPIPFSPDVWFDTLFVSALSFAYAQIMLCVYYVMIKRLGIAKRLGLDYPKKNILKPYKHGDSMKD